MRIEIDANPDGTLDEVIVHLTETEARMLLQSLELWAKDRDAGVIDPGWHTHIDLDFDAPELMVAITPDSGGDLKVSN